VLEELVVDDAPVVVDPPVVVAPVVTVDVWDAPPPPSLYLPSPRT
jgi:hypothetical protein